MSDGYSDEFGEEENEEEEEKEEDGVTTLDLLDRAVKDAVRRGVYKEAKTGDGRVYWYHTGTKETTWDLRRTLAGEEEEGESTLSINISESTLLRRREEGKRLATPDVSPIKPQDESPVRKEPVPVVLPPPPGPVVPDSSDFSDVSHTLSKFAGTCATVVPNVIETPDDTVDAAHHSQIVNVDVKLTQQNPTPTPESTPSEKQQPSPISIEGHRHQKKEVFRFNDVTQSVSESLRPTMLIEEQQHLVRETVGVRDKLPPSAGFGAQGMLTQQVEESILDMVMLLCLDSHGKGENTEDNFHDRVKKRTRSAGWESVHVNTNREQSTTVKTVKKAKAAWGYEIDSKLFEAEGSLKELVTLNLEKFVLRHMLMSQPKPGFCKGQAEGITLNEVITVLLKIMQHQGNVNHPVATYIVKFCRSDTALGSMVSAVMHSVPFETVCNSGGTQYRMEYWVTRNHILECIMALQRMVRTASAAASNRLSPLPNPRPTPTYTDDGFSYNDSGDPLLSLHIEAPEEQPSRKAPPAVTDSATLSQLSHEIKTQAYARTGLHAPSDTVDTFLRHTVHEVLTDDVVKKVVVDQVLKKLGVAKKSPT